jgi:hypothetical protein
MGLRLSSGGPDCVQTGPPPTRSTLPLRLCLGRLRHIRVVGKREVNALLERQGTRGRRGFTVACSGAGVLRAHCQSPDWLRTAGIRRAPERSRG